ncbi:MAG: HAD family hydrolase [Clostridiaceae bacterium]|nr:HAD family hydrolase [Clostridiaceae bacterium]
MIKLVAADLDGTLLDSKKQLSPNLPQILLRLSDKGIRFTPASGRQYYNLIELFPGLEHELTFIAENGAITVDRGETLFVDEIPPADLVRPLTLMRKVQGVYIVLAGEKSAYYADNDPVFYENAHMYYTRLNHVPNLLDAAEKDRICKIAVFQKGGAEHGCYPLLQSCSDRFQVVLSGSDWVDLMNPGVSKGRAMRVLQHKLGITPDECMAFGDYLNDVELLQSVTYSFAMENAHPDLKAISRSLAPSNDADGVVRTLQAHLNL